MKNVLIVEDNQLNMMLFSKLLNCINEDKNTKINIFTSNGFEDIKSFIEDKDLDLIIMDLHLPGKTGDILIKEIRHLGYNVPIIAVTAFDTLGWEDNLKNIGANDFIAKPIDVKAFIKVVKKYI